MSVYPLSTGTPFDPKMFHDQNRDMVGVTGESRTVDVYFHGAANEGLRGSSQTMAKSCDGFL